MRTSSILGAIALTAIMDVQRRPGVTVAYKFRDEPEPMLITEPPTPRSIGRHIQTGALLPVPAKAVSKRRARRLRGKLKGLQS